MAPAACSCTRFCATSSTVGVASSCARLHRHMSACRSSSKAADLQSWLSRTTSSFSHQRTATTTVSSADEGQAAEATTDSWRCGEASPSDECFRCRLFGHWARDCTEIVCGNCKQRGHRRRRLPRRCALLPLRPARALGKGLPAAACGPARKHRDALRHL